MQSFLPKDQSKARPIMDKDNQIVGYYVDEFNEFYIPNEIQDFESDAINEIIIHAIKTFAKEVVAEFKNINSWIKSPNKDRLKENIVKFLSRDKERLVQTLKNEVEHREERIRHYTRERSEERRVGKECRSRWARDQEKEKREGERRSRLSTDEKSWNTSR